MTTEEIYLNAIEEWRLNKGIGTAIIPSKLNYIPFVVGILQRVYNKNPAISTLIVVPNFTERAELIEALTHQDDAENNEEIKKLIGNKILRIYTKDFADSYQGRLGFLFTIIIKPDSIDESVKRLNCGKFKLIILDKALASDEMNYLNNSCVVLPAFIPSEILVARTSTPVEEMLIGVDINDIGIKNKLDKCEDYINTSLTIFGSLTTMDKCRAGDKSLNISAIQMCTTIATENGWSENLDMSYPFNVQLDNMYNPNNLLERARTTYDIIRTRTNLLSDYKGKLDAICDIVRDNIDKKILIINKRGEYATEVSNFLNNSLSKNICAPYHEKLPSIPLLNRGGEPILIKTGSHKGEPKIIAHKAQKTLNQNKFNTNEINVLSTNAAPDKDLDIDVQVIIITSPKCNNIEDYIYRLDNINFPDNKLKVYTIYCKNTIEEKQAFSRQSTKTHSIVNNCENSITFDENLGVVIC